MTELSKFLMGSKRWRVTRMIGTGMLPESAGSTSDQSFQEILIAKNSTVTFNINSPTGELTQLTQFVLNQPDVAITRLIMDGQVAYNGRGILTQSVTGLTNRVFKSFSVTLRNYSSSYDQKLRVAWQNVMAVNI